MKRALFIAGVALALGGVLFCRLVISATQNFAVCLTTGDNFRFPEYCPRDISDWLDPDALAYGMALLPLLAGLFEERASA